MATQTPPVQNGPHVRALDEIRSNILNAMLVALSMLTPLVILVILPRAVHTGISFAVMGLVLFCVPIWISTIYRKRFPYKLRLGFVLGAMGIAATLGMAHWGMMSASAYLILLACGMVSIFVPGRSAYLAALAGALIIAAVGIAVRMGYITFKVDFNVQATALSTWGTMLIGVLFCCLAGIAVLKRFHRALHDAVENLEDRVEERTADLAAANASLLLSEAVYRNTTEGIIITDAKGAIVSVNEAFTTITGYSSEEAFGQNPRILNSKKQDAEFYKTFWEKLINTGQWKGEFWNLKKDGTLYPQESSVNAVKGEFGDTLNYVAVISDITARKAAEDRIWHMASHDQLTGLFNRAMFQEHLSAGLALAKRTRAEAALLFVDLDGFKAVNDTLGHKAGDEVLVTVAKKLQNALRQSDVVARFGGDEFAILLPSAPNRDGAVTVARKVISSLSEPIQLKNGEARIGASIGVAMYPDHGQDTEELLKQADAAMYAVKQKGKNNYAFA